MSLLSPAPRQLEPELMDDPQIDPKAHAIALRALRRINLVSHTSGTLWRTMKPLIDPGRPLRILDIACGGGDVAGDLLRLARADGLDVEVVGCDISPTAVAHATARQGNVSGLKFITFDALNDPMPDGFDIMTCTTFLHHLTEPQVASLLSRMAGAAKRGIAISDLLRSRPGIALTWLGTRLLTRSPIVHVDGMLSVRAAFTIAQITDLAHRAGLTGVQVRRRWPERFLLRWSRT